MSAIRDFDFGPNRYQYVRLHVNQFIDDVMRNKEHLPVFSGCNPMITVGHVTPKKVRPFYCVQRIFQEPMLSVYETLVGPEISRI
jgi:hypothetical protein